MIKQYILILLFLHHGVQGLPDICEEGDEPRTTYRDVPTAFLEVKISPKYISPPPEEYLNVVFGEDAVVNLGNTLTPEQCVFQPFVTWRAEPDKLYTFMMFDPDAYYPDSLDFPNTYLHWGRYNIEGGFISTGTGTGADFASYLPITPPPGSDPHRFVQVVWQQQDVLEMDENDFITTTEQRSTFEIQKYVRKYNLGIARFGNFFFGSLS